MKKLFTLIVIFMMTVTCAFAGEAPVITITPGTGTYTVTSTSSDAALYYLCKPYTWLDEGETPESVLQDEIMGMASMIDSEETWELYAHMGMMPAPKTINVVDYVEMYAGQDMFIIVANVGWDGEKLAVISNVATMDFTVPDPKAVEELIDAIGTVSDSFATAKAISAARIAYDNLIAPAKALVTNYDDLVAAETLYNQMVSFDSYRNSRSLLLGIRLTMFDNADVRREVANASQQIQALEYVEELTLEENKKRVDEIYNTYLDILKKSRHDAVVADLLEVAKHNGKASIMLFLGISDSQRAIDAANEGIAQIDALEYDYEADLSANLDDVFDIVIDTKINIVKAWKADFDDLKAEIIEKIRNLIGIGTLPEAKVAGMFYDYSLTREENNAKLTEVMESLGGTTGINAVNAATAKNGKYVENGKLVIVKNGKAYTAAGQMK